MNIPRDKLMHFGVGTIVAIFALALWVICTLLGAAPLAGAPVAVALATLVAGIAKEGADFLDNRMVPGMHGVDGWDAFATALPGALLGLALHAALAHDLIPAYLMART